jgi:hypothetical protein
VFDHIKKTGWVGQQVAQGDLIAIRQLLGYFWQPERQRIVQGKAAPWKRGLASARWNLKGDNRQALYAANCQRCISFRSAAPLYRRDGLPPPDVGSELNEFLAGFVSLVDAPFSVVAVFG